MLIFSRYSKWCFRTCSDHFHSFEYVLETSEPAPTSLTPRQATLSPIMEGSRNSFFSSSEPNLCIHKQIERHIGNLHNLVELHEYTTLNDDQTSGKKKTVKLCCVNVVRHIHNYKTANIVWNNYFSRGTERRSPEELLPPTEQLSSYINLVSGVGFFYVLIKLLRL